MDPIASANKIELKLCRSIIVVFIEPEDLLLLIVVESCKLHYNESLSNMEEK